MESDRDIEGGNVATSYYGKYWGFSEWIKGEGAKTLVKEGRGDSHDRKDV